MERWHRAEKLTSQQIIVSVVFVMLVLKQADAAWNRSSGSSRTGFRTESNPEHQKGQLWRTANDPAITNSTARLGSSAFLHCTEPSRLPDRPTEVSWLRLRDWHLLTSGRERFTQDKRFRIYHDPRAGSWVLKISHVQLQDHGLYECQISTSAGRLARLVHLHVVQPVANIRGSGVYHVERGSAMSLTCAVKQVVSSSVFVVWHHNGEVFNPYKLRPDMKVSVQQAPHQTISTLSIRDVRLSDGGNYTCTANNARAASVAVFVSQGDTMAAVQRRKASNSAVRQPLLQPSSVLLSLIVCSFVTRVIR